MFTKRGKAGNGEVMGRIAAINIKTSKSCKSEKSTFSFGSPYKSLLIMLILIWSVLMCDA